MHLYFPFPIHNYGLFRSRIDVIRESQIQFADKPDVHFQLTLPNIQELHSYFQLIAHDSHDAAYLGQLLTLDDPWKFLGASSDLDNISKSLTHILNNDLKRAYIMTNTGGHHADNAHYELFCPLNQLFFIVEYLNYNNNFPEIAWIDVDAHFGNGDKKLFDSYNKRMMTETNNVCGFSIHNDYASLRELRYLGVNYSHNSSDNDFLQLVKSELFIKPSVKYVLVFFGTDIVSGDYGDNQQITQKVIPEVVSLLESKIPQGATCIYIHAGGADKANILALVDSLYNSHIDTI